MKNEVDRLSQLYEHKKHEKSLTSQGKTNDTDHGSEHETDEDEDDDYIDDLPE